MVDYAVWASADTLTVEQAAFLWAGIDPSLSSFSTLSYNVRAVVVPRLQMLHGAIVAGELAADSRMNALAAAGNFASSYVQRGDLLRFAKARGETPAFLFPPSRMKRVRQPPGTVLASELGSIFKDPNFLQNSKLFQDAVRHAKARADTLEEAMDRAEEREKQANVDAPEKIISAEVENAKPPIDVPPDRGSGPPRRAPNKINDDASLERMKKAIDNGEATSVNNAAVAEARKITKQAAGREFESTVTRLKRKFRIRFPKPA